MKIDDILIFRRASGVKRPEMTPKTGFSCLKTDLHQMLELKAILREGEVISISDVAKEVLLQCSTGALGMKTAPKMAPKMAPEDIFFLFLHCFV